MRARSYTSHIILWQIREEKRKFPHFGCVCRNQIGFDSICWHICISMTIECRMVYAACILPYVVVMLSSSLLITPINTSKNFSLVFTARCSSTQIRTHAGGNVYVVMTETNIKTSCSFFQRLGDTHTHTHTNPSHPVHNMRHTEQSTRSAHIPFVRSYILHVVFGIRKRLSISFILHVSIFWRYDDSEKLQTKR